MESELAFFGQSDPQAEMIAAWVLRLYLFGLGCLLAAPAVIAALRKHPRRHAIMAVSVLFGMTGVVWGVMLVKSMESCDDPDCVPLTIKAKLVLVGLTLGPFMIGGTLDFLF